MLLLFLVQKYGCVLHTCALYLNKYDDVIGAYNFKRFFFAPGRYDSYVLKVEFQLVSVFMPRSLVSFGRLYWVYGRYL